MKNNWSRTVRLAFTGSVASLLMGCQGSKTATESSPMGDVAKVSEVSKKDKKSQKVDFLTEVKPLLENYCLSCHNTGLLLGDLNLETRVLAFSARQGGGAIVPGKPESSRFYQVLKLKSGDKKAMPPEKHRMSKGEREVIFQWIKQGAHWPKDSRGTLRPVKAGPVVAMLAQ
ncbi:MAG: hypothetical protein L3J39_04540 [Verrucomicrobiales bacterium]|nr:hypothetical protein [Verrucomicrobiales bacterium]